MYIYTYIYIYIYIYLFIYYTILPPSSKVIANGLILKMLFMYLNECGHLKDVTFTAQISGPLKPVS